MTEDEPLLLVPIALLESDLFRLAKRRDVRDGFAAYLHIVLWAQLRQLWFDRNKGLPSDWTGAEIPYERFGDLLRAQSAYRKQFLPLESAGLVVRTAEPIYHVQASSYQIPVDVMQRGVSFYAPESSRMRENLQWSGKLNAGLRIKDASGTELRLYDAISQLEIDWQNAWRSSIELPFLKQLQAVESIITIAQKRIDFSRDRFSGRLHSPLTFLPSDLRQYLHVDGRPLASVDAKNCQPLVLSAIVCESHDTPDARKFREIAEAGILYEEIMSGVGGLKRPEAKQLFLKYLYSHPEQMSKEARPIAEFFRSRFPTVHDFAVSVKLEGNRQRRKGYNELARMLQERERKLIIDRAAGEMLATLPPSQFVGTIHDSLVCFPEDVPLAEACIERSFADERITVRVESKPFREEVGNGV